MIDLKVEDYFDQGYSVKGIARILGCSESTVRRHLKAAKERSQRFGGSAATNYSNLYELWLAGNLNVKAAAIALGVSESTIRRRLKKQKEQAAASKDFIGDGASDQTQVKDDPEDFFEESPNQFSYFWITRNNECVVCRIDNGTGYVDTVKIATNPDMRVSDAETVFNDNFFDDREPLTIGCVTADFSKGSVTFTSDGKEYSLPDSLVNDIVSNEDFGIDLEHLMKFADRLSKNPSNRVFTRLYDYIRGTGIEITDDGMIQCYKRVTHDYHDIHSGTFDNSPGSTPSILRSSVDEDENKTCAESGLHVCSADYLPNFSTVPGDRIVLVEVDPADVVSIPRNEDAKCRCCKYHVIKDVSDEFDFVD